MPRRYALTPIELGTVRKGFTLIELLVVVAIIVALLAILMPSMGRAIEVTQRTICASKQRSIGSLALSYAANNHGAMPSTSRDNSIYDHITWINSRTYADFVSGFDWDAAGNSFTAVPVEDRAEELMFCPNRLDWKIEYKNSLGIRTGFFHFYGHYQNPTFPGPEPWASLLRVGQPVDNTWMTSDIIERGTVLPGSTSVSHSYTGAVAVTNILDPKDDLGSEGGNVGQLDGSVVWKAQSDMVMRRSEATPGGSISGWW